MLDGDGTTRRQWLATCAGAAGVSVLAGCLGDDNSGWSIGTPDIAPQGWPMHGGGPANTRHRPEATGPGESAGPAWEIRSDQFHNDEESAVVDGIAYITEFDSIRAIDDGEMLWETGVHDRAFEMSTPLVVEDTVYVGGSMLAALDRSDGTIRWKKNLTINEQPRLSYYDGAIYCPSDPDREVRNDVLKFDPDAREEERLVDVETGKITATPAIANDTLYLTSETGVHAIDVESGSRQWHFDDPDVSVTLMPPVVADGTLYAIAAHRGDSSDWSILLALDATSGEERWRYLDAEIPSTEHGDTFFAQRDIAVADGTVYLPTGETGEILHAVDAETGERRWEAPKGGFGAPAVVDGVVYGAGSHSVCAIDPSDGSILWEIEELLSNGESGALYGRGPVVSADRVYQPVDSKSFVVLE